MWKNSTIQFCSLQEDHMHKNVIKVSIISTSAVVMMMSMIAGLTFNKWAGIPVYSYPKAYLGVLFASSVFCQS